MACVNKNLPGYKELSVQFGDKLAESLVVSNNFNIPTIQEATTKIRGTNILSFKKAIRYLQSTTSPFVDDLLNNFNRILQKQNDVVYVIKGSTLQEPVAPLAETEILDVNTRFLQELNTQFGPIFEIQEPVDPNLLQENKTGVTQAFFTDVVTGKSDKFKPKKAWSPILPFTQNEIAFKNLYEKYKGNFDEHIATSIPTFRETQIKVGAALSSLYNDGAVIYDIGGSEGGFVKAITESSENKIKSINLDVNEDMQASHNAKPINNSVFVNEAFLEPYTDESTGKTYPRHVPQEKADVVHESMVFQFISPERDQFIGEIKNTYLKPDGIVLLEEKIVPESEEEWRNNEARKDAYKLQYYPQEALDQKRDEVLVGMKKNQTAETDLLKALKNNFKFVTQYWNAGNFKGYAASNSKEKLDEFISGIGGEITSPFSSKIDDVVVSGKKIIINPSAEQFYNAITTTISKRELDGSQVEIKSLDDYQKIIDDGGYLFLAEDGSFGSFVTNDGYMGSLFKDPDFKERIRVPFTKLMANYGIKYSDSYAMLEKANNDTGFKSVARLPFDEAFAPEGWENTTLKSRPDIVFYAYSPNTENKPNEGQIVSSYDEGLEVARDYSTPETEIEVVESNNDSNIEVKINADALNALVDKNIAKKPAQPLLFEEPEMKADFQKLDSRFWSEQQKRNFSLSNVSAMLNTKFGIQFETINDDSQRFRGKFSNGKIIINEYYVTPDTPFHEIIHPFIQVLKNQNSELYSDLKTDLLQSDLGQTEFNRVQVEYPELSNEEQVDEAIASTIGILAGQRSLENKPWYKRFLDWIQSTLANMGVGVKGFDMNINLSQFADLILDPSFRFELSKQIDLENTSEYLQKVDPGAEARFNNTMDDVLRKLRTDVNIPSKNEDERTRKFFSGKQLQALETNRRDLEALDSFVLSALAQTKSVTEKFEKFREIYEGKTKKSPEDIRQLSDLLYQVENNLVLYSDLRPLVRSMIELFPEEEDNWGSLVNYLDRQDRLIDGYKNYGIDAISEWLMPYMKKTINQAKASGNIHSIVPVETYTRISNSLKSKGVTDEETILYHAIKQEIQDTLKTAKSETDWLSSWFSGVLNTKDSVSQLIGLALSDEMQKAFKKSIEVKEKLTKALRQYRGNSAFVTEKDEVDFYKKYLRQANSYEYVGLDKTGKEKYEYVKRWAFNEEYLWDEFYNAKRDFMQQLGERPSRENRPAFKAWEDKRKAWYDANTKGTVDKNGKSIYIPADKYLNPQFRALMSDPFYAILYNNYKDANDKFGSMGLKYGIVPQVSKGKNLFSGITKTKSIKEGLKKAAGNLRETLGDEEQIYYAENIEGFERKTIPINNVRLLEEDDLSFNLTNGVSKLATSAEKYTAMRGIEPQVMVLKNFINGNSYLKIDKRQALQNSAKGIAKLKKGSKQLMPVEAKKLNDMLNGFINDVMYGESDDRQVIQIWGSRFVVYTKGDTSNNGSPVKSVVKNFEDLRQMLNKPDLNYSDFKVGEPLEIDNYVVTLSNKDVNWSLNKTGNFAGIMTAVQNMALNVNSIVMNVGIGNIQSLVESVGGKNFTLKDWGASQKEYWAAVLSGSFLEDTKGDKQSTISQLMIHYDALQGEFEDELGRPITSGIANKLLRRDRLFVGQSVGEHQIQATGLLSAMRGQKVQTTGGQTISLREAWERDAKDNIKLRSDIIWSEEDDVAFRNKIASINKELNGNFSKLDKARLQRIWWGRAIMMFRKHVYNSFVARYGKEKVSYERGQVTEGYYRTFFKGMVNQLSEVVLNKRLPGWKGMSEREKYATRKLAADLGVILVLLAVFRGTDDDDDENEFNDQVAFWSRRLLSDTSQYAPVVGWLELWKMVKDPSASANTLGKYYDALSQLIVDPEEVYERSGPGYTEGELKWKVKMAKVMPIYRQWINIQNPENMLEYYQLNVKSIFNKKKSDEQQEELQPTETEE